jgi:hypothetical protein
MSKSILEDVFLKMLFENARNINPTIEPIPLIVEEKENPSKWGVSKFVSQSC